MPFHEPYSNGSNHDSNQTVYKTVFSWGQDIFLSTKNKKQNKILKILHEISEHWIKCSVTSFYTTTIRLSKSWIKEKKLKRLCVSSAQFQSPLFKIRWVVTLLWKWTFKPFNFTIHDFLLNSSFHSVYCNFLLTIVIVVVTRSE